MENSLQATDDYLNFLLSIQNLQPIAILSIFFLTLGRILPLVAIVPFLGAKNIPKVVRMMFGVALCMVFLPQNLLTVKTVIPYNITYIGYLTKEVLIGSIFAIFASAPFFMAQMAGTLIDHSRGSSALQVTDPTTQSQTSPIGILFNYVTIVIFFSLGGPFLFFNALADSYAVLPVDQLVSSSFFNTHVPFWKFAFSLMQKIMNLAIQFASPALIGILLTDLFLGIANRLAPQVQIVFLGISLKSWVGLALMTAAWALLVSVLGKESTSWMKLLQKYIYQVSYSVVPR